MTVAQLLGTPEGMAAVCAVALAAGFAHGLSGFGFPVISTPMVALFADVRAAVLITLFPNLVINAVSAVSGGDWRANLRRYWTLPVYVLLGTIVGTQVVIFAPANPLRLFLAAVIVVYLRQDWFRRIDWSVIVRHPERSAIAFGLVAGFLSGTVNVMLPPILIYFTTLGLAPLVMTQVMNACFLVGKVSQAVVFALHGQFTFAGLALTIPVCIVALAGYGVGRRLQPRVSPALYKRFIRGVLWAMSALLVAQALGWIGRR